MSKGFGGKLADPAERVKRARKARAAQESPDFYLSKLINSAPAPTAEQAAKLRAWLRGVA